MMEGLLLWLIPFTENMRDIHTKQDVEWTITSLHLQTMIGSPTQSDFEIMVHLNMIMDSNLNAEDCKKSYKIFGKNLTDMRGKTVRVGPDRVEPEYVDGPMDLVEKNTNFILNLCIKFVNGIPFLVTND